MKRRQTAVQKEHPVFGPEVQEERQHPAVFLRQSCQTDRELRDGEDDIPQLARGGFHSFLRRPAQHVRMNRRSAGKQAQINDPPAVGDPVAGTVARTENIGVFAHRGRNVILTEFDQNVRIDRPEPGGQFVQQQIDAFIDTGAVASGIRRTVRRIGDSGRKRKTVKEIQFEPVQFPLFHEPDTS